MAYLPPLDGVIRVTSAFGLDRGRYRHGGIDLALQRESVYRRPVKAPAAGTVLAVWTTDRPSTRTPTVRDGFPFGNAVALRDDAGVLWRLLHFDEPPTVRVGERVAAGQTLGLCDSTGNSTGHHVHLDASPQGAIDPATFRVRGSRVDPLRLYAVAYARDAMDGLGLANTLMDGERREDLASRLLEEGETLASEQRSRTVETAPAGTERAASVRADVDIPTPPDLKAHVLTDYDLDEIFPFINPQMLYVRHLGYRDRFAEALDRGDEKAVRLRRQVQEVEEAMLAAPGISARAVFKWFPVQSDGRQLLIYAPDGKTVIERFLFGRQREGDGLCLADYTAPVESGRMDYVAMFVTTVGSVRAIADRWRDEGEYLKSHALHALAIESAEGFAELVHQRIRQAWGFGDSPGTTKEMLFKARYRGKRYSFGYPACPRLEDQEKLFRLLDAEERTGVALTEGHMMDPESSVSALVFHHPDAKYFNLSDADTEALEREFAPAR